MNSYVIVDAITKMDDDIIAEYFSTKKAMLSKRKRANGFKTNWKGLAVLAACFILMISSAVTILVMQYVSESGVQTPDKRYNFGLGEVCENDNWNGTQHSIVFNEVFITNNITESKGYYIVFVGDICTSSFSFPTDDIRSFGLDFRIIKEPDYIKQNKAVLEKDISEQLSDVDLLFNGEKGQMEGAFRLVFSIDEQNFNLIKEKSPQTSYENNVGIQITFEPGIYWCGGNASFVFKTSEVRYVEKIN